MDKGNLTNKVRKIVVSIYYVILPISILLAVYSPLVFNGGLDVLNLIFFILMISFPLCVFASILLSRKSTYWLLLPVLPFLVLMYLDNLSIKNIKQTDLEFCTKAIAENDLKVLNNRSIGCQELVKKYNITVIKG